MQTIKVLIVSTLILLGFSSITSAQLQERDLSSGGSFYSAYGFGAPSDPGNPFSMGMGLTGVSNYSGFSPSIANPAHWGLIGYTQGNVSLGLQNFNATDNFGEAKNSMFGIESFQFVVPLMRNELGLSFSFSPLARSDFQLVEENEFTAIPDFSAQTVQYGVTTTGTGGVNRVEVGLGYRLSNFISVGYGFSANLLTLNQVVTPVFSDPQFRSTNFSREAEGYGFGHRFGVQLFKGNLFGDEDQLALGLSLSIPTEIETERKITSFRQVEGRRTLVDLNEGAADRNGTVKLPLEINAGITYNLNRQINFVAEYQLQDWSNAEFSFNPGHESYYKDRTRTGFGFQYHPYRAEQQRGFFSNFKYSLGTTYDNGHLAIDGQNIETLFLNAGIGIMSQRSASSIDLSFQYGIRGTQSSNLVKEDIWGFKLSLNLAEFMFMRSRFQ